MSQLTKTAAGKQKAAQAAFVPPPTGTSKKVTQAISTHRSWTRSICLWGILLPCITLVLLVTLPLLYRYVRLQEGQPYSLIANQTVIDYPGNYHSRYRGPDYLHYDRFFFQWWNFLVYDAETHDHWTVVYHTTKFSKAAGYDAYASTSMVHKIGPKDVLSAHDAIPLSDLEVTNDWDLALHKPDGTIPHRMTVIDSDTYNVVANLDPSVVSTNTRVRFNLTFHRVHGMYSNLDNEEGNKEHCSMISTLFGYHSKVSGWIEEGEKRWTFSNEGAAGKRYRAYAAGSYGCRLPAGYPEIQYPWTWVWLIIPGDSQATPPRPEIGLTLGTARFQLNHTLLGDLYGGFASIGIGEDIVTSAFGSLHHNTSYELPLTKASTDQFLQRYELGYANWTDVTDDGGVFTVPLIQTYDIETAHYRLQLTFHTRPEQYFRLPVVVEHMSTEEALKPNPQRLAVFSDFRACGLRTEVKVWKRTLSPAQQLAAKRKAGGKVKTPISTDPWVAGGYDSVVFDGEVSSLNAIEFAYQAPLDEAMRKRITAPQKFAQKKQA